MHDGVATRDVDVELIERVAAELLEVLLDFDLDIVTREIMPQRVAVRPELLADRREENLHRHARARKKRWALVPWGARRGK